MQFLADHQLNEAQAYAILSRTSAEPRPHADLQLTPEAQYVLNTLIRLNLLQDTLHGVRLTSTGEVVLDQLWVAHSAVSTQLRTRLLEIMRSIAPISVRALARALGAAEKDIRQQLDLLANRGVLYASGPDTYSLPES